MKLIKTSQDFWERLSVYILYFALVVSLICGAFIYAESYTNELPIIPKDVSDPFSNKIALDIDSIKFVNYVKATHKFGPHEKKEVDQIMLDIRNQLIKDAQDANYKE